MVKRSHWRRLVARALVLIGPSALAAPAMAQSMEVHGHAGFLGEWELVGTVTANGSSRVKQFTGPLKITHVGVCTQDGPEVKDGELRFQLSGASRMKATLVIDGAECSYSGKLSESYSGMMSCPDKRAVPLKLWVK
jgi:hypothetical protein